MHVPILAAAFRPSATPWKWTRCWRFTETEKRYRGSIPWRSTGSLAAASVSSCEVNCEPPLGVGRRQVPISIRRFRAFRDRQRGTKEPCGAVRWRAFVAANAKPGWRMSKVIATVIQTVVLQRRLRDSSTTAEGGLVFRPSAGDSLERVG